ncbi:Ctr-domain-containing protein [Viridothelium virens]|uniref:Copper transport protein n=1 Tax=Viridothelium virens TaxID=1048519 RepID=A0A6A6H891_VIRVR|nr:Ctr-domain-containing protein [Viridothelium virens]
MTRMGSMSTRAASSIISTTTSTTTNSIDGMSMGGMSMGTGSACQISMLWNWYTTDSCFLSSSWHVKNGGIFAGSCIGVIFLVIALESLRRLGKEYDRQMIESYRKKLELAPGASAGNTTRSRVECDSSKEVNAMTSVSASLSSVSIYGTAAHVRPQQGKEDLVKFRPSAIQQVLRALLHMVTFGVAYIIMLLVMSYNGYIIICVLIGAFLGFFMFQWDSNTIAVTREETTLCC